MRCMLYFDHAASTPIYPEVLDFLKVSLMRDFANPSAAHKLGKALNEEIELARKYFLNAVGANSSDQFIFTSSATESNNMVIKGLNFNTDDTIVYSMADHKSIVEPVLNLSKKGVNIVELLHFENGQLNIDFIDNWLEANKSISVKLLLLSLVNNQSGNILNVNLIAQKFKNIFPNIHIHIDAVQGFTKIPYQVNKNIDSLSIASHKMGGPKSIAGLFLRSNINLVPLLLGGGQQSGFRSSTENYSLIKGMQIASEISLEKMPIANAKVIEFEKVIKSKLIENIKGIMFPFENTSPYIITFILPGIPSDVMLRHLELKEIYLSSTSACSSRIKAFNPTLKALIIPEKWHKHVLRMSLSPNSTREDVELFLEKFLSLWNEIKYLAK